jgi:nucleoside-diphosphate-sugar epimerase
MCEWLGINYSTNYDMDFIAVRFPTVYGPTKLGRGWTVPLMDVVENPVAGMPAVIATGGDVRQELLYVKDAARTVVNAALVEATEHQIFNLGSSTAHTMHEMSEVVTDRIPEADIEIGDGPDPLYGLGGRLDLARSSNEIGHEITYTLDEGIDDWIEFLRSRPQQSPSTPSTISTDIPTIKGAG